MIDTAILFSNVLILFLMVIPGFMLKKTGLCQKSAQISFANTILYVTTPAMIIISFIRDFDMTVLTTCLWVLFFSLIAHPLFYLISLPFFKKCGIDKKRVFRFSVVFANSGYMGIPLIMSLMGSEAAIYATFYVVGFNFYMWSLGAYIYTDDKSYISPKKMFLNAATIPTYIGLIMFVLPINSFIPDILTEALSMLRATVAPMSMLLIGMQLADVSLKHFKKISNLIIALALRLIVCPLAIFAVVKLLSAIGICRSSVAGYVTLISACAPCASATGMFAEKFNGDRETAGQAVAISTLLSVITMPLVANVLKLL